MNLDEIRTEATRLDARPSPSWRDRTPVVIEMTQDTYDFLNSLLTLGDEGSAVVRRVLSETNDVLWENVDLRTWRDWQCRLAA